MFSIDSVHDVERVAGIPQQNEVREERPDSESEERAPDERVHALREDADQHARHDTLEGRPDHDADDLIPNFGREQRRQPVNNPQNAAERRRECQAR